MIIGSMRPEGYDFYSSRAVRDGLFVGIVLDEDIQLDRTEERIFLPIKKIVNCCNGELSFAVEHHMVVAWNGR